MTEKRFGYRYNEESALIQIIDNYKDEPNANSICNVKGIVDLLNEQEERIQELEQEKESWKSSACHDLNLKSMLAFEIGKLTETKDIDAFLDFYYKYFCNIGGEVRMTENKRFTVKGDGVNAYCVSDKLNIYPMPILSFESHCKVICTALNELNDENEQLKQQLFEARKDYIIETADISDKPYYDKEMEELWKEIFE